MEIILLIIRIFLFGVFALAGVGKLLDLEGSEKAMKAFGTPDEFAKTFAIALPFAEIVFAVCFLFTGTSWVGAIGALILLLSFIGGMIWQISQGKAPDCHCFGQIHSEPVGKKSLIRNIGFALLALFLAAQGRENQGMSLTEVTSGMMQMFLTFLILVTVGVLLFYVRKLSDQQAEILRRIDVLGFASSEIEAVERNDAGDPNDGLPIGAPLPAFAIPDINGKIVQFDHLLAQGKPLLFLFVGAACQPCEALMPEIHEWEGDLQDKLKIVFISSGDRNKNLEKFGNELSRVVLIEKTREFALTVNAKWTPTALFVGSDGNIASHIAAGDVAIRRLIEKIKDEDLNKEFVHFLGLNGFGKPRIGQRIPSFSMTDIKGKEIRDEHFEGRKTLVAFSSLTCPHCVVLMNQIRDWEKTKRPANPNFVIFSDGEAAEYEKLGLDSPVLLEKDYTVAKKFGMLGLPSAVLINEDGIIVTEAAIGPTNIWALIGERR